MKKINIFFLILFFFNSNVLADNNNDFEKWKIDFKQRALANNISEKTFDLVMADTKFLENVIKYDRYQPEFYEDTKTYVSKRSSTKKLNKGIDFYQNNKDLINIVENKFEIEKELLLALMGIETNYGTYVGKMDILSSLISIDVIACPIIGPSSTPDLTRCTVQPANLTPDFMALSWVFKPLKDGRREG